MKIIPLFWPAADSRNVIFGSPFKPRPFPVKTMDFSSKCRLQTLESGLGSQSASFFKVLIVFIQLSLIIRWVAPGLGNLNSKYIQKEKMHNVTSSKRVKFRNVLSIHHILKLTSVSWNLSHYAASTIVSLFYNIVVLEAQCNNFHQVAYCYK